jgi:hypothetical protein
LLSTKYLNTQNTMMDLEKNIEKLPLYYYENS